MIHRKQKRILPGQQMPAAIFMQAIGSQWKVNKSAGRESKHVGQIALTRSMYLWEKWINFDANLKIIE